MQMGTRIPWPQLQIDILNKTIQNLICVPGGALLCMTAAVYISYPYLAIIKWVSFILGSQRGRPFQFETVNNISEMQTIPRTMGWFWHVLLV